MVSGLFSDQGSAEVVLNNLYEASYSLENVSVVAQDPNLSVDLNEFDGPLGRQLNQSVENSLENAGLSLEDIEYYKEEVDKGSILIVLNTGVETDHNAVEIFQTSNGSYIKEINNDI